MTDRSNLYALETTLSAGPICDEFDLEPFRLWLGEIRRLSLHHALPQLIAKLDRMSRVAMSAAARRQVLCEVKRPLLKAVAALPKPLDVGRRQNSKAPTGMLLEQRLYCLIAKNLKQVLQDLDLSGRAAYADAHSHRCWALRNLFRFLARQIEFSLFWGQPLASNTWRELHDTYSYVVARGNAGMERRRFVSNGRFDPEQAYKRLLVLGLAGRLAADQPARPLPIDELDDWSGETELVLPAFCLGQADQIIVETTKDSPPRKSYGVLSECFLGWVLIPSRGYLEYAAALEQDAFVRVSGQARR